MPDAEERTSSRLSNLNPQEAHLESLELSKYLLAKSYFDCREFERCAAVFLPSDISKGSLSKLSVNSKAPATLNGKGKEKATTSARTARSAGVLPKLSQKALFLGLYAKYLSGEKKKDEESEMILGPADKGTAINLELVGITRILGDYFATLEEGKLSGGWLEYLYGIVLAKGKNDDEAQKWLIKSVHLFPYNWGAWLELNDLIGSVDQVSSDEARVKADARSSSEWCQNYRQIS